MAEGLVGIIGGTGLGDVLGDKLKDVQESQVDTPFGNPSGAVMLGRIGGNKVAFINRHGDGHKFMPSEVPFAANIFALKKLGVKAVISSGAVGSLREKIKPGDLVVVDQFIDKTFKRQCTFFDGYGAVHCELAQPTCGRLRRILIETSAEISEVVTHDSGTYVCMEGPQFSTRAESLMHRAWGGDLIGMTAMPEAKLAREAQMCYAMVAMASDYDCWREHEADKDKQTLLKEIIGNLNHATENLIKLIEAAVEKSAAICDDDCPCRSSLEMAVWTSPEKISDHQKDELKVLFD
ncbi:MAG: S-methyl-5'-thioadenosine phosphorylase [Planctomycetota bacterium]|jgi:5'-methylthioadenosine phosphorylase